MLAPFIELVAVDFPAGVALLKNAKRGRTLSRRTSRPQPANEHDPAPRLQGHLDTVRSECLVRTVLGLLVGVTLVLQLLDEPGA